MSFASLDLIDGLLRTLESIGYKTPTPIQKQAIPAILAGRDLLGAAQTGTGKTAAFALPLLQRLAMEGDQAAPNHVRCLVLVPTRELADQVYQSFHHGLSAGPFSSGRPSPRTSKSVRRHTGVPSASYPQYDAYTPSPRPGENTAKFKCSAPGT